MPRQHIVVVKGADGRVETAPMKEWLRRNPEHLPKGLDTGENTSYQIRRALRRARWELEELDDRVLLIKPDEKGDTSFADKYIEEAGIGRSEDEAAEAEEVTIGLERDLQDALRKNIEQLEPGLKITDGGKERTTDAGRIDITATDAKGQIVVIELKAGSATQDVIAQILAYMSVVAQADKKTVRGIIVAGDFHKRVVQAARAVPALQLKEYRFRFTFQPVE
jgi:RecB family endonuclease NucS